MYNYDADKRECINLISSFESGELLKSYYGSMNKISDTKRSKSLQRMTKNYERACKTLEILENPFQNFDEHYNYVMNLELNTDKFKKLRRESEFPTGGSIKSWINTVIYFCENGKIKEKEIIYKVYDLYSLLYLNKNDELANNLIRLSFFLGMSAEDLALFLNISLSKLLNLEKDKEILDEKNYKKIVKSLKDFDRSQFMEWQVLEIDSFANKMASYNFLPAYVKKNNPKNKSSKFEINFENWLSSNDIEYFVEKCDEIKDYLIKNKVNYINQQVRFKDGSLMYIFLNKLLRLFMDPSCNIDKKTTDCLSKELKEIIILMFNENVIKVNKNTNINYGVALSRVLFSFNISVSSFFESTKIPASIINGICNNSIYPSADIVETILLFLKKLIYDVTNNYQAVFLEEAKKSFNDLYFGVFKKGSLSYDFILYDENFVLQKENLVRNINADILSKVKLKNRDWYLKWLTCYYLFFVLSRKPEQNEYFYDGSIIYKWILTQKYTLNEANTCTELSDEQIMLLDLLMKKRNKINFEKSNSDELKIISNFDHFYDLFYKRICNNESFVGEISGIDLMTAWDLFYKMYLSGKWFSVEQYEKIRTLRRLKIEREYALKGIGINPKVSVNFGLELAYLMDVFNLSITKLSRMSGCSVISISFYCKNKNIPNGTNVKRLESTLKLLNSMQCTYAQNKEIESFMNVLNTLKTQKRKVVVSKNRKLLLTEIDSYNYGNSKNVFIDIDRSILEDVKNNFPNWYNGFLEVISILNTLDPLADKKIGVLYKFKWYINAMNSLVKGELSEAQKILLGYVVKAEERNNRIIFYKKFYLRFNVLEHFIIENKRIPKQGEIQLYGEIDGYLFYRDIRDKYWGFLPNKLKLIDEDMLCQIKNLLIETCDLEFCYEDCLDSMENGEYFIGQALNHIRISLGYSNKVFEKILGFSSKEMNLIYKNMKPVSFEKIEEFLSYLNNLDKSQLRKDQLSDLYDFYNILNILSKENNMGVVFKLKLKGE